MTNNQENNNQEKDNTNWEMGKKILKTLRGRTLNPKYLEEVYQHFGLPITPISDVIELFKGVVNDYIDISIHNVLDAKPEELQNKLYALKCLTTLYFMNIAILKGVQRTISEKQSPIIITPRNGDKGS